MEEANKLLEKFLKEWSLNLDSPRIPRKMRENLGLYEVYTDWSLEGAEDAEDEGEREHFLSEARKLGLAVRGIKRNICELLLEDAVREWKSIAGDIEKIEIVGSYSFDKPDVCDKIRDVIAYMRDGSKKYINYIIATFLGHFGYSDSIYIIGCNTTQKMASELVAAAIAKFGGTGEEILKKISYRNR